MAGIWSVYRSYSEAYRDRMVDGVLTSAGDKAVGCITNGAIITAIATKLNMQIDTISKLLGNLAGMSGCGGIVDMNQAQASPEIQNLVQFAGNMGN